MPKEFGDFSDEIGVPGNDTEEHYEVKVEVDGGRRLMDVRSIRFDHSDRRVVIETDE